MGKSKPTFNIGKSGGMSVKFEWTVPPKKIAHNKGLRKEFYKEFGQMCKDFMAFYVPFEHGYLLRNSQLHPTSRGCSISYNSKYAAAQYTGKGAADPSVVEHGGLDEPIIWERFTPGTTSYWDKAAWCHHKKQMVKEADKIRKKYSK